MSAKGSRRSAQRMVRDMSAQHNDKPMRPPEPPTAVDPLRRYEVPSPERPSWAVPGAGRLSRPR